MTTPTTSSGPTSSQPLWHGVAGPYTLFTPAVLLVLGGAFQAVDTLLAKEAFDVIINQNQAISILIAVTVAAIGALAAVATGIAMRSRHRIAAVINGTLWLGIGAAMALIRYNTASLTGNLVGDPSHGLVDKVTAGLMLLLYLAAGTGIIYSATKLWNPMYRSLFSSRRHIQRLQRQLSRLEPRYTRTRLALDRFPEHRNRVNAQHATAHSKISAHESELKARARLLIGQRLSDPTCTALIRQETWPTPPREGSAGSPTAATTAKPPEFPTR